MSEFMQIYGTTNVGNSSCPTRYPHLCRCCPNVRSVFLPHFSFMSFSLFWAADTKGTMSYRTEGEVSVQASEQTKEGASKRMSERPIRLPRL